jgi:methyl-galactoside transport system substrate-binding protein
MIIKKHRKKTLYRIVSAALCALLSGALAGGCGYADDEQVKSIKIGVTLYDQYDTFISQLMDELNDYAAKKSEETGVAISIDVMNASGNQSTQNTQVESMIDDECDVICVNLVDRTEPTTIIDLAEKNDIPVIFFNRELVAEDLERGNNLYYVGADALVSGILEGELAAEEFLNNVSVDKNGDGIFQYVVLEGEAGHQDAIMRTEYSVSTITDYGIEVEKLGYGIANWNRAPAQNQMSQMISSYGDRIELVLANNDDMALGAIDALKAEGIPQEDWPAIVGIDGTDVGLEAIKNGEMIGTVYNDKEGQADAIIELAYRLAANISLENLDLIDGKYIRLPYSKVTPDNVDDYR